MSILAGLEQDCKNVLKWLNGEAKKLEGDVEGLTPDVLAGFGVLAEKVEATFNAAEKTTTVILALKLMI